MKINKNLIRTVIEFTLAIILIIFIILKILDKGNIQIVDAIKTEIEHKKISAIEEELNIKTSEIEAKKIDIDLELSGTTDVKNKIRIISKVNGLVEEIHSKEGLLLEKGDKIISIEKLSREEMMLSAKSNLKEKIKSNEIDTKLSKEKFTAAMDVYKSEAAVKQAEQMFKEASLTLEDTEIYSPIKGYLEKINYYVGDFVDIGDHITTIIDINSYIAKIYVPEKHINKISTGDKVDIIITKDQKYEGEISFISKDSTNSTRSYLVEARINNKDEFIPSGMSAITLIKYNNAEAYYIPSSALIINTEGIIGIKYVENEKDIKFAQIEIVSQKGGGYWIKRKFKNTKNEQVELPNPLILIVDGAYYVKADQE